MIDRAATDDYSAHGSEISVRPSSARAPVRLSAVSGLGLVLTAVVTGMLWGVFGPDAVFPAAGFGLLAAAIQVAAVALARPAVDRSFDKFILRWGFGMGLRLLGVVLFAVAATTLPDLFPALPTAFGFLGVLIPLLFMETRFLKMSDYVVGTKPEGP